MSSPAPRIRAVAVVAVLFVTAACGGGDSEEAETTSETTGATTSTTAAAAAVPADVVDAFTAADKAQTAAFAAAEARIRLGRSANNLTNSQNGGREARTALFNFDAALRKISFPPAVSPAVSALITSIGTAIAAFDEQNTATDQTSFLALDAKTGRAVVDFRAKLAAVRTALGVASPAATPTTNTTTPKYATRQTPVSRPYINGTSVTDAKAWRDDLLTIGKNNVTDDPAAESGGSFGIVEAWVGAFPFLPDNGVVGTGREAPASGISGFTAFAVNDKDVASASNPTVLVFAVKDASGNCAAGALYGAEIPNMPKVVELPAGSPCTSAAARDIAEAAGFK